MAAIYWGLVSLRAQVASQEQNLELAKKLYSDNKRRVEIGTLAPIEIIRAEAEVAARDADLTAAQTEVQLQETLLKDAISVKASAAPPCCTPGSCPPTKSWSTRPRCSSRSRF